MLKNFWNWPIQGSLRPKLSKKRPSGRIKGTETRVWQVRIYRKDTDAHGFSAGQNHESQEFKAIHELGGKCQGVVYERFEFMSQAATKTVLPRISGITRITRGEPGIRGQSKSDDG